MPDILLKGPYLLSRDEFRMRVFARDGHLCVNCGAPAVDAHHIIERRLFSDGGYYVENGASLCGDCHYLAETTELDCQDLRERIGIKTPILPEHLYKDQAYDKWGNPILPNGQRLRGDLFDDPSVQKVLASVLHLFTTRVKYPRTYHLPWSPGVTKDDRVMPSTEVFEQNEVVITIKMDGENTTLYQDYLHARSINYEPHESRSRVKAMHAAIARDIPEGWRVCGENLYAKHSIGYTSLAAHFLVFSVWDATNTCLSWDETIEWATLLGFKTVPLLYRGGWNEKHVRALAPQTHDGDPCEGYVARIAKGFHYKQFRTHVGKYVRANHVTTHGHWMRARVEPNGLKSP